MPFVIPKDENDVFSLSVLMLQNLKTNAIYLNIIMHEEKFKL